METGAIIGVVAFFCMALLAVLVAVIAAVAAVTGFDNPEDRD